MGENSWFLSDRERGVALWNSIPLLMRHKTRHKNWIFITPPPPLVFNKAPHDIYIKLLLNIKPQY